MEDLEDRFASSLKGLTRPRLGPQTSAHLTRAGPRYTVPSSRIVRHCSEDVSRRKKKCSHRFLTSLRRLVC